ncbi:MAG: hypothetical protein KAJ47_04370, partial [Candidatus Aenigmarchaeota archaeon]|nr:hypothetical protein [Candidatus Aenigmarchaeota archaeon]
AFKAVSDERLDKWTPYRLESYEIYTKNGYPTDNLKPIPLGAELKAVPSHENHSNTQIADMPKTSDVNSNNADSNKDSDYIDPYTTHEQKPKTEEPSKRAPDEQKPDITQKDMDVYESLPEDSKVTSEKPQSKNLRYDQIDFDDLGLKVFIPGKAGLLTEPQCNYYIKHLKPTLDETSIENKLKEYGNKIGKSTEKYGSDHTLSQKDHDNCMFLALEYIRLKKVKCNLSVPIIAGDTYNMYDTAAEILTNNNDPTNALMFYAARDVTGIEKSFNSNKGLNTNKKALDDPKMMIKVLSLCLDSIYRIKSDPSLLADVEMNTDEKRKLYTEGAMEFFVARYNLFNDTYPNEPQPSHLVDGYCRINQDFKD